MICRICKNELPQQDIFATTYVCKNCGFSGPIKPPGRELSLRRAVYTVTIVLSIAIVAYLYLTRPQKIHKAVSKNNLSDQELNRIKSLNKIDAENLANLCFRDGDLSCLEASIVRLHEIDPKEVDYTLRLAQIKQKQAKFNESLALYEELINSGEGHFEMFAGYALTLDKLNRTDDAIKWYQEALSLEPALVDVTKNLAVLLVKKQNSIEALSLLNSFISAFPNSRDYLSGNISAIQTSLGVREESKEPSKQIRLIAVSLGHHFVPIKFEQSTKSEMFLVDTGATTVSLKTKDFEKFFPGLQSEPTKFKTSDGISQGFISVVPKLIVGDIELKNIEISHCKTCSNLAGQSLLKKFNMATSKKGQIEYLTLTLRE